MFWLAMIIELKYQILGWCVKYMKTFTPSKRRRNSLSNGWLQNRFITVFLLPKVMCRCSSLCKSFLSRRKCSSLNIIRFVKLDKKNKAKKISIKLIIVLEGYFFFELEAICKAFNEAFLLFLHRWSYGVLLWEMATMGKFPLISQLL